MFENYYSSSSVSDQSILEQHFNFLSPYLVRIVREPGQATPSRVNLSSFEEMPTEMIMEEGKLEIATKNLFLTYDSEASDFFRGIQAYFRINGRNWKISDLREKDTQNLGGVIEDLDRVGGHIRYDKDNGTEYKVEVPEGLLSRRGWTALFVDEDGLLKQFSGNDVPSEKVNEIYLFLYGQNYAEALRCFFKLTGDIPMVPAYTLGAWYSRYMPYKEKDYHTIAARFKKEKLPLDVLICDMNWHPDGWAGLRYDKNNFPDMARFLKWIHESGMRIGFNHHPGEIAIQDPRAKEFCDKVGLDFEKDQAPRTEYFREGEVTIPFDLTDDHTFSIYWNMFLRPLLQDGVDFHWIDGDVELQELEKYYKLTGREQNTRPVVLCRQIAGSFHHHTLPLAFSGDTYIEWESMAFTLEILLAGQNNGIHWSHDIGGFRDGNPSGEMYARWLQLGALSPVFRLHGGNNDGELFERLPWAHGDRVLESSRTAFQLRYALLPYLYTLFRDFSITGEPVCRGMYFQYPDHEEAYDHSQYMVGDRMLVAPILSPALDGEKGKASRMVWIPDGAWYDYFTGRKTEGPAQVRVDKTLNEWPVFVKEGSVIPMRPYMNNTTEEKKDKLQVELWPSDGETESSFTLYEDDGNTLNYLDNSYSTTLITARNGASDSGGYRRVDLDATTGSYQGQPQSRDLTFSYRHSAIPTEVRLNGNPIFEKPANGSPGWTYCKRTNSLNVDVPAVGLDRHVKVEAYY
ncbi:TIM-barrel domain-containing protein [Roseivirga sp. BDSF3-8]|uniref:glycoside hydrolase family 31 protein n=1 Tax=Roseivirga sp. BDSF3-8 TaxID=3241598 RepID=UPI0035322336